MKLAPLTTLAQVKPQPENVEQQRKLKEATESFEAVLIRQMLSSLERTTRLSGSQASLGNSSAYGSMMVDALSDAIAHAGGLGLAKTLDTMVQSELQNAQSTSEVPTKNVKPLK